MYPKQIIIEEQGLRDGLQVEEKILSTEAKLNYINRLIAAGVKRIQVGSFVHPKLVPQMADTDELCQALDHRQEVLYSGLVLNQKGLERALKAGLKHVAISFSASDTHSQKNARKTLAEAKEAFKIMVKEAKNAGLTVRSGIQCAFGCRYEGQIASVHVLDLARFQLEQGIDELALADSTGMGNPQGIASLMAEIKKFAGEVPLMLHLHDTEGKGIANMLAAMQVGVQHFDTALAGLGGCPFIKGATGNIATEDALHMLEQMGIATGIDSDKIISISRELQSFFGRKLPSKMLQIAG